MAKINRHETRKEFRVGTTADEQEEAVKEHNEVLDRIDEVKSAKKEAMGRFNAEIKELVEQEQELRQTVKSGKLVTLDVIETRNFDTGKISWVLASDQAGLKKGRVMESRDMTEEDKDIPLPTGGDDEEKEA